MCNTALQVSNNSNKQSWLYKLLTCSAQLQAEIGRYSASDREWEVYRFLLDENCEYQLLTTDARNQIVDKVRRMLMGW